VLDWSKARIDILFYVIDQILDFRSLNTIRQTCKAVQFRVDRQLVIAHNSFAFDAPFRLAKLLNVVLRRPEGHIPVLYQLHITFSLLEWDADHTAIISCLARVLERSTSLVKITLRHAKSMLLVEPRLVVALARIPSLRELVVEGGFDHRVYTMLSLLQPGLRKLFVHRWEHQIRSHSRPRGHFLRSLLGLRSTLEELKITSGQNPLAISNDGEQPMVWPKVSASTTARRWTDVLQMHTLHLENLPVEIPDLAKAFPNLRRLYHKDSQLFDDDDAQRYCLRNRKLGICWRTLDTVALNSRFLWATGLTCPVRALYVGRVCFSKHAKWLLQDLPVLRPVVLELGLVMPAVLESGSGSRLCWGWIEQTLAVRILESLPRVKALKWRWAATRKIS
jgi:hypothetical protein